MELKSLILADQSAMVELLTSDSVKQTYMLPDFAKKEDAIPLFLRLVMLSQDKAHFVRGIYESGALIGFLNDVEIENVSIELGYVIHPIHQRKGYATEALNLAIEELFCLGYREVIAGAFVENTASIRVMEKAGMERLSRTEEIEYRGKIHSCVYYQRRVSSGNGQKPARPL